MLARLNDRIEARHEKLETMATKGAESDEESEAEDYEEIVVAMNRRPT